MSKNEAQNSPRLSVVMTVYNGENYIEAAVQSILSQDISDIPILIVNDGSTDTSGRILAQIAKQNPHIRVFNQENRGIPESVNELFGMVSTEYVTRMDADDISLPGRFSRQIAYLDAHPEIDVLGAHALYIDSDGRPIYVPKLPLEHDEIDTANLRGACSFIQSSVMMRSAIVRRVGGYDPHYRAAQDLDFWLRAAEHGRLANLPDVLLKYRITQSGVSGRNVSRQAELAAHACRSAWRRRGLPDQPLPTTHWRPLATKSSLYKFALQWGWQAWNAGNQATARHFFRHAIRLAPFSREAWTALAVAMIRRSPRVMSTDGAGKGGTR